jgi:hypothetical protein
MAVGTAVEQQGPGSSMWVGFSSGRNRFSDSPVAGQKASQHQSTEKSSSGRKLPQTIKIAVFFHTLCVPIPRA